VVTYFPFPSFTRGCGARKHKKVVQKTEIFSESSL
jgi:hypothetical protein